MIFNFKKMLKFDYKILLFDFFKTMLTWFDWLATQSSLKPIQVWLY